MAKRKRSDEDGNEEEGTDYNFDPGSQVELEPEDSCCVTGEDVKASFARYPDYRRGTLMVMSKTIALQHLRAGTSLQKFKEVLVERHGEEVLKEYKNQ
ncbi:MAG: hypothetical protein GKR89_13220 [Candidatus Latescibacteria bacterium]|nr:hypothetical protein [Candidatus Latescibacterota bacterium]